MILFKKLKITIPVLLVFGATFLVIYNLETRARHHIGESLSTILQTVNQTIDEWINHKKTELINLSKKEEVIRFAETLSQYSSSTDDLINHPLQSEIQSYFEDILAKYGEVDYQIADPNFINLSSMKKDEIGQPNLVRFVNPFFMESIQEKEFIITPPLYTYSSIENTIDREHQMAMIIASPIRNKENDLVAALIMTIDPRKTFMPILESGRTGETGETYAFDHKGRLVSFSRFKKQILQSALKIYYKSDFFKIRIADPGGDIIQGFQPEKKNKDWPLTYMAQNAISGGIGHNVEGYRDYRGVRVLGSWLWNENIGLGISTEIDEAEALSSFYYTRQAILGLLTIVLLVFLGLAFYLAKLKVNDQETISKLAENDKMASLGLLSAGISHELNNPVNAIYAGSYGLNNSINELFAEMEKKEPGSNSSGNLTTEQTNNTIDLIRKDIMETVAIIQQGTSQAIYILRALKNFSRQDKDHKTYADVHDCLNTALALLDYRMKNKIQLIKNYEPNMQKIFCLPGELNQVFVNILSNAEQAIEDKGEIIISTHSNGDAVSISIKDNGAGMDDTTLEKLFEPFYTTKAIGEGTGLGLSISKRIISKHQGKIKVKSKAGKGTEFEIILPILKEVS